MHVLVTGGCGFVGTALTQHLLELGYQVTVYDIMWFGNRLPTHESLTVVKGDIRDTDHIPVENVEAIIHLANIANDPCGELNSKLSWEVNVLATMGMVEKAISYGVRQFIYASSGSVYGVKDEAQVTEELSLVPISDYNKTKMISERVLLSYGDTISIQCIRPATICGYSPRIRLDLSVNMLTMQALTRARITVLGGSQTRPNIHIRDMISVYQHFLELGDKASGIFNAGFENISIMDIAQRIAKVVPADIVVTESNDPRSYRLNSDKLLSTGFTPKYGVAQGIQDIVEAYQSGKIRDDDSCYNIRTMKTLSLV
jgi:nucleoside-diphosphate-sugar epimerase